VAGSTRVVWALYALVTAAIVVTYSRVPPEQTYHVSHGGIGGGLGRALVYVNFPVALVAIAIVAIAADRLRRRAADGLALAAFALCAVVAWPGVVDQGDLDAKLVNVVPAIGVGLALALSLAARDEAVSLGRARAAAAIVLLALSIPWIAAELGEHVGLGVFLSGQPRLHGADPLPHAAVHLGEHHGFNGVLLALTALLLWPALGRMRRPRFREATRAYLGLLLVYGLVNGAQDFWTEQVVKRGWVEREIPGALEPRLAPVWAVMIALAAVVVAIDVARTRRQTQRQADHQAIIAT
jgi:hypothetical protein